MATFEEYLAEISKLYRASSRKWTQETRIASTITCASYKGIVLYIGAPRKLELKWMMNPSTYEFVTSYVRVSVHKDMLTGNTDNVLHNLFGEAVKKALESGVAIDENAGNREMDVCPVRSIVARREIPDSVWKQLESM